MYCFRHIFKQVLRALLRISCLRMGMVCAVFFVIALLQGDCHSGPKGRYHTNIGKRTEDQDGKLVLAVGSPAISDSCGRGEYQDLTLPDGSSVRIARGSRIAYATDFGKKRETYLRGRASFDIKSDKNRPFIIHAGSTTLEMMGTRLDVTSDKNDRERTITLASGKIKVTNGNCQLVLEPGEQAFVDSTTIRIQKIGHPESSLVCSGKELTIEFDSAELDEVIQQLARAYYLKIVNADHIRGIPVTGNFLLKDPLDKNLALIQCLEKWYVRLEIRHDTILLTKPKP